MAGIYIHIPFCKQACHYCDFHFSTSLKNKESFISALKKEIKLQKDYLKNEKISTIYFGGGTPSLLYKNEILEILEELNTYHQIDSEAEITLEANPDDLTMQKIKELKKTPVNRLSIGIQSFFDDDLKFMNRAHNSNEALSSVKTLQDVGFDNITIDLIYGIPNLSDEKWKKNLKTTFDLNIQHVSSYCLTVEPRTALASFIKKGQVKKLDDEQGAKQFQILMEETKNNGFIQYEISNFSKEGFLSKHNSNYWLKEKYLGLGPSAHSYNGNSRQWNVANNFLYIQSLEKSQLKYEKEILSEINQYNEYIMTSLRTIWGIDLIYIQKNFGKKIHDSIIEESRHYINSEHLINSNHKIILSDKGKLIADKIASDLFTV